MKGHNLAIIFSPLYPIARPWSRLRTGVNYKLSAECNEAMDRLGADTGQYRPHLPRPHTAGAASEADKFIFHRFNYSPITAAPRVKLGVYGDRIGVFRMKVSVFSGVSLFLRKEDPCLLSCNNGLFVTICKTISISLLQFLQTIH